MEQERPHKVKRLTMLGLGLTSLLILAFAAVVGFKSSDASTMSLNEWGDFLAGVSALLALLWLVIGYFQHGEELRLNTEALRAQQSELQHQVQETAQLVEAAKQQAIAAQQDLQHRQSVEAREAKPEFVFAGATTSAGQTETNIRNRGGEARNVALDYDGPHELSLSPADIVEPNGHAKLVFQQARKQPLNYPVVFQIICTDRLGHRHSMNVELAQDGRL